VSATHSVCAQNYYIAILSTIVETSVPEREVEPALALLGPVVEKFVAIADLYAPIDPSSQDQVFVSKSYDSTSHFETVCDDVKDIWKRLTGAELKVEGKVKREEDDA
jgi:Rab GDP dissociation inhibitor